MGSEMCIRDSGEQIINAFFGWGSFSSDDAIAVWLVLSAYSLGLPAIAASRLIQNTCWSLGDTKGPARIAGMRVLVASGVGLALMFPLDLVTVSAGTLTTDEVVGPHLGAVGLALGSAFASWVEVSLLSRLVQKSLPGLMPFKKQLMKFGVPAALTLLLAAVIKLPTDNLHALLSAPIIIGVSTLFYTVFSFRSGIRESDLILRPLRRFIYRLIN